VSLRMIEKTNIICRCEGWVLFLARTNPLRGLEIAYPAGTMSSCLDVAKEHAYSTLLATTFHS